MVATAGSLSWSPLLSLSPPRLSQPAAAALPRYLSRRGTGVCASTVGLRFFSRFSPPFSRGGASPRAWGVGRSNVWRHGGEAPRIVPVRPSTAGPSPAALPVVPVLARRRRAPLFRCLSYPLPFFPRPLPVPSLSSLSSFLPVDHVLRVPRRRREERLPRGTLPSPCGAAHGGWCCHPPSRHGGGRLRRCGCWLTWRPGLGGAWRGRAPAPSPPPLFSRRTLGGVPRGDGIPACGRRGARSGASHPPCGRDESLGPPLPRRLVVAVRARAPIARPTPTGFRRTAAGRRGEPLFPRAALPC